MEIINLDRFKGFAEKAIFAIFQFSIEFLTFLRPFYAKIGDWGVVVHIFYIWGCKGNFF